MQKLKFRKMTKFKKTQVVNYIKMKMLVIHFMSRSLQPHGL